MLFYIYFGQLIFFKINYFEKYIPGMHLECQTVWIQIEPDLDPNCLQRLSSVGTSRQRGKDIQAILKHMPLHGLYRTSCEIH